MISSQDIELAKMQQQPMVATDGSLMSYQQLEYSKTGGMPLSSTYAQQSQPTMQQIQRSQLQSQNMMAGMSGSQSIGGPLASGGYTKSTTYTSNVQMSGPPSSAQYVSSVKPFAAQTAAGSSYAAASGSQGYGVSPASYIANAQQYTSANAGNQMASVQRSAEASWSQQQQRYTSQRQAMGNMMSSSQQAAANMQSAISGGMTTQATSMMSGGERYKSETRVVGHEYGEERVISVTQRVDESRAHIVNERVVEHEVRVPKRIVREEIFEKVIVVPEKIIQEEYIEEMAKVQERIVEVAKPIIVEKVVEQTEYEIVEKRIEVPEVRYEDRIQYVDRPYIEEKIVEKPVVIEVPKPYDVPEIVQREVPYERIVEVPEWRDEIVPKYVQVPQVVQQPVPNPVPVEKMIDVERIIPVPVEANITYEFRIPKIKPRYHKVTYPVYLPRFIEVPVALELLQGGLLQQTEMYLQKVGSLTKAAASLCEIENLATTIMNADIQSKVSTIDLQSFIMKSWKEGSLNVGGLIGGARGGMQMATATNSANYSFAAASESHTNLEYNQPVISSSVVNQGMRYP